MWCVAVRQPAVFCLSHLFKAEVFSGAPLPIVVIRSKHPFAESHDGFMLAKVMDASSRMGLNSSGELFAPKEKAVLLSARMSACPKRLDGWTSCICCQAYHKKCYFCFNMFFICISVFHWILRDTSCYFARGLSSLQWLISLIQCKQSLHINVIEARRCSCLQTKRKHYRGLSLC